jgi:MerR family transcriptional regulator, redox-sensitive transcriptional activator SoxR
MILLEQDRFVGHATSSSKLEVKRHMSGLAKDLSVGQMAARAGVPVSTLHYYEAEGLIRSWRTAAGHRRFDRSERRRVAVVRVAQSLGLSLSEIRLALGQLPRDRVVSAHDWSAVSDVWRGELDRRIERLQRLRDQLGHCIGCGCLSVESCPLYNPEDRLGAGGSGPRRVLGPL